MAIDNYTPEQIEEILQAFFEVAGTRQYIGARYVPIFGRGRGTPIEWDNSDAYEPLSIVYYQGDTYTSRRYVPAGIAIDNQDYWVITGRYNAQVEQYRQEVLGFSDRINGAYEAVEFLRNEVSDDYVPFPDSVHYPKYGTLGQVLTTLADGETKWEDPVVPSDAQAEAVITTWLNDHPEATTTVQDGSLTPAKFNASANVLVYRGALQNTVTSFADIVNGGYYSVSGTIIPNITDKPSSESGMLFVVPNFKNGADGNIFQLYIGNQRIMYCRFKSAGGQYSAWNQINSENSLQYKGGLPNTITAFSSVTVGGYYSVSGTILPNITDKPANESGMLFVVPNFKNGADGNILQLYIGNQSQMYCRFMSAGGQYSAWTRINSDKTLFYRAAITSSDTALSSFTKTGYYNLPGNVISYISDMPENASSGVLIVYQGVRDGLDTTIIQQYIDANNNLYIRNVVGGTPTSWVQANSNLPISHNKNLITIGDSITCGYYDDSGTLRTDINRSWPYLLSKCDYNVTNIGIGGMGYLDPASTEQRETYLDVIRDTDFTNCDCFIISGGINDYKGLQPLGATTDTGETTILGVVNTIIDYMTTTYPTCRLIFTSPYNSSVFGSESSQWCINYTNAATVGYTLKEMSDAIAEICDANGITYIDLMTTNCFNYKNINDYLTDRVHPSHDAQWQLAGFTVAKVLAEIRGVA